MSFIRRSTVGSTALLTLLVPNLTANPATARAHDASAASEPSVATYILYAYPSNNNVLTLSNGSSANGTPVIESPKVGTGAEYQKWVVTGQDSGWIQVRNKATGTCLANPSSSTGSGTKLIGHDCLGKGNTPKDDQLWAFVNNDVNKGVKYYALINKASGKCLTHTGTGVQITQEFCHDTPGTRLGWGLLPTT